MEQPTLNSRLRVLVAKTFRAEQLFGSARNIPDTRRLAGNIIETANEIRSREWHRSYAELRSALNNILALTTPGDVRREVAILCAMFSREAVVSEEKLSRGVEEATVLLLRREFSALWKTTGELIRQKAIQQVSRAISDELTGILRAAGVAPVQVGSAISSSSSTEAEAPPSNVIPLRRRAS